jgi:hypothetical protein
MKKTVFLPVSIFAMLVACNKPVSKKVMIMGRGQITATGNEITMKDGSGYTEETIEVNEDKPVTWNVNTPTGKINIDIPADNGFYVLNLKTDTIVGSQQNIGQDLAGRTMTQEELKVKIDSLVKLTNGTNVSAAAHNYFILPNKLVKVSSNLDARVYGPFNKIPSTIEADKNGGAPEIYKLYTNTGLRELIVRLKKNTI